MIPKTKKIWVDGKFVDWEKAKIHILTHSLHYGGGAFEGIRAYETERGPAVFRLKEHLKRLFFSSSVLGMKIPFSQKEIEKAIIDLIKINKVKQCYIRPLVIFGYGVMGLYPKKAPINVIISLWPWKKYLGKNLVKVKISEFIRIHPRSTVVEAKICGHYVNSILASIEAKKEGFDEALLLDYKGFIAEGPGENIFLVKNKKIFTPKKGSILPGITRDTVITIAKEKLNLKVEEKEITLRELKNADELFFAGTAVEISPIVQVERTIISNGKEGEVTKKIRELYQRIVSGKEPGYLKWLKFIQ